MITAARSAVLALAAVLAGGGCATTSTLAVGQPIAFSAAREDGASFALEELQGQVVVAAVWATWCRACPRALGELGAIHREAEGLALVAINVDEDPRAAAAWLEGANLDGLVALRDPGARELRRRFAVRKLPTIFLVDRAGIVRHTHEGFHDRDLPRLHSQVRGLLAEATPAR